MLRAGRVEHEGIVVSSEEKKLLVVCVGFLFPLTMMSAVGISVKFPNRRHGKQQIRFLVNWVMTPPIQQLLVLCSLRNALVVYSHCNHLSNILKILKGTSQKGTMAISMNKHQQSNSYYLTTIQWFSVCTKVQKYVDIYSSHRHASLHFITFAPKVEAHICIQCLYMPQHYILPIIGTKETKHGPS